MYKNIGGKIKNVAEIITTIGCFASVVLGILVMVLGDGNGAMIFTGLVVMAIGCFGSWLSTLLLYGYGQMIENSDKLVMLYAAETKDGEPNLEQRGKEQIGNVEIDSVSSGNGKCDFCGKENVPVFGCAMKDGFGTRYRNVCADCAQKYKL